MLLKIYKSFHMDFVYTTSHNKYFLSNETGIPHIPGPGTVQLCVLGAKLTEKSVKVWEKNENHIAEMKYVVPW